MYQSYDVTNINYPRIHEPSFAEKISRFWFKTRITQNLFPLLFLQTSLAWESICIITLWWHNHCGCLWTYLSQWIAFCNLFFNNPKTAFRESNLIYWWTVFIIDEQFLMNIIRWIVFNEQKCSKQYLKSMNSNTMTSIWNLWKVSELWIVLKWWILFYEQYPRN